MGGRLGKTRPLSRGLRGYTTVRSGDSAGLFPAAELRTLSLGHQERPPLSITRETRGMAGAGYQC